MAEQLNLTIPIPAKAGRKSYKVDELHLQHSAERIDVWLLADNGERLQHVYFGATATALMTALNKANLSTKSLHRRVMEKLIADGHMAGTISGAPD